MLASNNLQRGAMPDVSAVREALSGVARELAQNKRERASGEKRAGNNLHGVR